ncbi:MAG TPA: hypothetical protein VLA49_15840 [Anaerolineales bacterium]|nr:hypothetical protein [Anaerolineales bacterium]
MTGKNEIASLQAFFEGWAEVVKELEGGWAQHASGCSFSALRIKLRTSPSRFDFALRLRCAPLSALTAPSLRAIKGGD